MSVLKPLSTRVHDGIRSSLVFVISFQVTVKMNFVISSISSIERDERAKLRLHSVQT